MPAEPPSLRGTRITRDWIVRPSASTSLAERTEAGTAAWIVSMPASQTNSA
jgi:hypothetical protein